MRESLSTARVLCAPAGYYMDGGYAGSEPLWAHEIVSRLARRVAHITAVTGDLSEPRLPPNVETIVLGGMKDADVLAATVAARYMLAYGIMAARLVSRSRFDLVHHVLPFGLGQTYNVAAPFLGKRPFVVGPVQGRAYQTHIEKISLHGARQRSRGGKPLSNRLADVAGPVLAFANRAMLKRADAIVAISDEAVSSLREYYSGDDVFVIPPGVDTTIFQARPPHTGSRIELLTVGYLLKRKRVDVILRALRRLLDKGAEARLKIAGDGPERDALHALAEELRLVEHVTWLGFVPNRAMPQHYADADVFLSASEHEGLATVFLECLATGLPLVGASNPGSRAVISDELRGRIVPQHDDAAMADAIVDVFGDRERCERRSLAIRRDVESVYDWEVIADRYLVAYDHAMNRAFRRGWRR
jgi:glycosyltransferase involved in cell wall biosynthesis